VNEMYFYAILAIWLLSGTSRTGFFGVIFSIPLIMVVSLALAAKHHANLCY